MKKSKAAAKGGSLASSSGDSSKEFHQHFGQQYLERYPALFEALAQPVEHAALVNPFSTEHPCQDWHMEPLFSHQGISCYRYQDLPTAYPPPPTDHTTRLKQLYWMDFASVLPAVLLDVSPGQAVLDMCAAPGGKSLILAQLLLDPHNLRSTAHSLTSLHLGRQRSQQQLAHQQQQQQQQQEQQQGEVQEEGGSFDSSSTSSSSSDGGQLNGMHQELSGSPGCGSQQQQQQQQEGEEEGQQKQQEGLRHDQERKQEEASSSSSIDYGKDNQHHHQQHHSLQPATHSAAASGSAAPSSSSSGRLVANEVDPGRRSRLQEVVQQYLPAHCRRWVRVTGHDANRHWSRFEAGMYDRVLLDAPCSSDRHVVAAAVAAGGRVAGSSWSLGRCQQLAKLQTQLLLCALRAVKPGGRVVYSTCSLSNTQNDEVVEAACKQYNCRALQPTRQANGSGSAGSSAKGVMPSSSRSGGSRSSGGERAQGGSNDGRPGVRVLPTDQWNLSAEQLQTWGLERTRLGVICLPDVAGWGPIYATVLEKAPVQAQ